VRYTIFKLGMNKVKHKKKPQRKNGYAISSKSKLGDGRLVTDTRKIHPGVHGIGDKSAYNYEMKIMQKQFVTLDAVYAVSGGSLAPQIVPLGAIPVGNTNNTRLGDTVILDSLEIIGSVTAPATQASQLADVEGRIVVTFTVGVSPLLPLINNAVSYIHGTYDPDQIPVSTIVLFDRSVIVTPRGATGSTIPIDHSAHVIRKHINFHKRYHGLFSQQTSGTTGILSGNLTCFFITEPIVTATTGSLDYKFQFSVGFHDLIDISTTATQLALDRVRTSPDTIQRLVDDKVAQAMSEISRKFIT